jgi:OOP family OmpA-OmpF porin/outer membrane immunogenic protein
MKNTVIAIALAAAGLLAAPAVSRAADNAGGFFVNGNIGQSNLDKGAYNDSDTGFAGNIGYRWAFNPSVALGVEGGYTYLGKFSTKSGFNDSGIQRAEVKGWTLGVNGHFNIAPEWYLSGRTGWFRADTKGGYLDAAGDPVNVDGTSNKFYAGVGLGYDFSNNFSVGLNYDYYRANTQGLKTDPDLFSVSAEVRF